MGPEAVVPAIWLLSVTLIGTLGWLIGLLYERVLEQRWREVHRDRSLYSGSDATRWVRRSSPPDHH